MHFWASIRLAIANSEQLLRTAISMNKSLYSYNKDKYLHIAAHSLYSQPYIHTYMFLGSSNSLHQDDMDSMTDQRTHLCLELHNVCSIIIVNEVSLLQTTRKRPSTRNFISSI